MLKDQRSGQVAEWPSGRTASTGGRVARWPSGPQEVAQWPSGQVAEEPSATLPPCHLATSPLRHSQGNAFIEYLVIALGVLLATIAFFENHLKNEGVGARGSVEAAFGNLCEKIAGAACQ